MADYVVVDKEQLESDLTTVADTIRDKFELTEKLEFPDGMSEAIKSFTLDEELSTQDSLIEQIKTALEGKISSGNSENPLFYATNLRNLFQKASFPENYTITLKIPNLSIGSNASYMFNASNIYKIILEGDGNSNPTIYSYFCNGCSKLVEVDISNFNFVAKEVSYMFASCNSLKTIIGEMDFSKCTTLINPFNACNKLEEVRFKKETIPLSIKVLSEYLTFESIQSIIDGLADLTDTDTQTLTLHADVKAKLTGEQIATIIGKNWTLA